MRLSISVVVLAIAAGVSAVALADEAKRVEKIEASTSTSPYCLKQTGSHLNAAADHCVAGPGRSYSREDLENTGAVGTADALRRLSPALH